jgi:hypothetical protein
MIAGGAFRVRRIRASFAYSQLLSNCSRPRAWRMCGPRCATDRYGAASRRLFDCAMINAEILANNQRAEALASEQNAKIVQNVAAGVVGVVVWPVWFAMDAKGAASTDAAALQARQQYLSGLAAQRCAPAAPPPTAAATKPAKPKPKPQPQASSSPAPLAQAPSQN